jgi:S1-C subfamily serine protease
MPSENITISNNHEDSNMNGLPCKRVEAFLLACLFVFSAYAWCAEVETQPVVNETTEQAAPAPAPLPTIKIAETDNTYEKSVVMLEVVQQKWDYKTPWKQSQMARGVGTGFIIDKKRILTNAHNISNIKYFEIKKQNVSTRYVAKVVTVGHDCDLAIVDVADPNFYNDMVPLEFGNLPKTNSAVNTCGFPMGGKQVSVTKGVVSRIEVGNYSHTQSDQHLLVQTDAAINPGNSGGPVMQDGKVVGVAFQGLQSADNIGYMIPTTVIRHFLKDIDDGTYNGFASSAVTVFEGLHNPAYRAYLQLPSDAQGVVILFVQPNSTANDIFKAGDVLTKIGDFDIDNDGMIKIYDLTLDWSEVLEQQQIGESVQVAFYRNGKLQQANFKAALNPMPLPWGLQFDKQPSYYVYAGITFTPLSRNYLQTFGAKWVTDIPFPLRYLFFNSMQIASDPNVTEYVVVSEILPDEANTYCTGFLNQVVDRINGVQVHSIKDVIKELQMTPSGDCHQITFWGGDIPMILDAAQVAQRQKTILQKYEVPSESYIQE